MDKISISEKSTGNILNIDISARELNLKMELN